MIKPYTEIQVMEQNSVNISRSAYKAGNWSNTIHMCLTFMEFMYAIQENSVGQCLSAPSLGLTNKHKGTMWVNASPLNLWIDQ